MSSALNDINLAFLDLSDTIVEIVTYDSTTIHNTMAVADAFRMIGYPASKVRYLVNRADSSGGIEPIDLERALGRVPEHRVVSDGMLVVQSNNEGVPFVLAEPDGADQPGHPARRRPSSSPRADRPARGRGAVGAEPPRVRSAADRGLRLGRRRADGPPRDPPPVARANRRSTSATTSARRTASRPDDEVRAFSIEALDELVDRDVKAIVVACNTSTAVALGDFRRRYDLPILGVVRPGAVTAALTTRNRRVGVIATPGDGPLPRLFQRDQGREPGGRGLRARDAGVRARSSRPAGSPAPTSSRPSPSRSRRCSASAMPPASSCSRCPPRPGSTRSCWAAPTTRCCAPVIAAVAGERVAIVD